MRSRSLRQIVLVASVAAVIALAVVAMHGQANWYPSKWGAADQRGAANRITPAKVLEARDLIKQGKLYQLGHVYEPGMPMYGTRHFSLRIPQAFPMPGKNQAVYHDEIISGELGQIGTQFDGLGHLGIGDLFYNGNKRSEFAQAEGLSKLGVENVGDLLAIDGATGMLQAAGSSLSAPFTLLEHGGIDETGTYHRHVRYNAN